MNRSNYKFIASMLLISFISGCSSINPYTGEKEINDTSIGTGVGAAGGAVVGALLGGGKGAAIGGILGAATGGIVGNIFDRENEELRQALVGSGVQVRRVGHTIQLVMAADVTFETNQANVQTNFYPTLNSITTIFKKYQDNTITITGYTDNTGSASYNLLLSEERAANVGSYLISRGVPPNRIFTKGRGRSNPIAPNTTARGRSLNRRVVINLRPIN